MQQIFVDQSVKIDDTFMVEGEDARHLLQVLRMRQGEQLRVSTHEGDNYLCQIDSADKGQVTLRVLEEVASTELEKRIYLFQAVPKGDRMETVIEKAVELGVYEIIPVEMKYCVVKLDAKKKAAVLTQAGGVKLKDIQSIDYSWGEINFEYKPMGDLMMDCCELPMTEKAYDLDIEPDDIDVSDTVTVVWEIA